MSKGKRAVRQEKAKPTERAGRKKTAGKKSRQPLPEDAEDNDLKPAVHLVAIGASAGGLEAINQFFDHIPANSGCAFVVIQHLSPDYKSLLAELVSKHTKMHVMEARHGAELKQDCVYIIPTRKHLTVRNNRLKLVDKANAPVPNNAIDLFFSSAAKDKAEKAIAVILSGTGSDGSQGLTEIKRAGGLVLVQDPSEAKFDGMPNSASATGLVDLILPVSEMGEVIRKYHENEEDLDSLYEHHKGDSTEIAAVESIITYIREHSRHDFTLYKRPTIYRRIQKRMAENKVSDFIEYLNLLQQSDDELQQLCRELFINVTRFFRDKAAFDTLKQKVIIPLIKDKKPAEAIKVWVTACSSGEEAYSIAILFAEGLQELKRKNEVKIFATDIVKDAIDTAAVGLYPTHISNDVDKDRLENYFSKKGNYYAISQEIRKMVIFAVHDVIKDPPFTRTDLITCRNMLIYMSPFLQKKILQTIHFSLNPKGYLFMGSAENPGEFADKFTEISKKWKILQNAKPAQGLSTETIAGYGDFKGYKGLKPQHTSARRNPYHDDAGELYRDTLSTEFGYAAVFVNEQFDLIEAIGDFKQYLRFPDKRLDFNILKLVGEELSLSLGIAMRKVLKSGDPVIIEGAMKSTKGKQIDILLKNAGDPDTGEKRIMLVFYRPAPRPGNHKAMVIPSGSLKGGNSERAMLLEQELKEHKTHMQKLLEELETTNEELQSSNEEMLSSNEELQSTNEELQSLNEELHTINTEHQLKIQELIQLNDDLNNYFRSTEIGQVFIDRNLVIRKFTPAVMNQINLIESDIGRSINHISTNLRTENFMKDVNSVMETGKDLSKKVQADSRWFQMNITPYLRQDKKTDGVVVTFVDITEVQRLNTLLEAVLNSSPNGILAMQTLKNQKGSIKDFNCILSNNTFKKLFRKDARIEGKCLPEIFNKEQAGYLRIKLIESLEKEQNIYFEFSYKNSSKQEQLFDVNASRLDDGVAVTFTDITEKKQAESEMKEAYSNLYKAEESLREMNVQLEEKIRDRTQQLEESEERFRLIASATHDAMWDWRIKEDTMWLNDGFVKKCDALEDHHDETGIELKYALVHPDDRSRIRNSIKKAIEEKSEEWLAEFRICSKEHEPEYVIERAKIIYDEKGQAVRMLGAMMDLTQLRKAEKEILVANEKARFLTEVMPHKVWTTDAKGIPDFFNQNWLEFTGFDFNEAPLEWTHTIHSDERDEFMKRWKRSVKQHTTFTMEHRMRRNDKSFHWHLTRCLPQFDQHGNVVMWVCSATDIDDQKSLNITLEKLVRERTQELSAANKELQQGRDNLERKVAERTSELQEINTELSDFASVVAHDLKAPLRAIGTLVDFLEIDARRHLKAEDQANLDLIKGRVRRMSELINGILQYTRIGRKDGSEYRETIDMNNLVSGVVKNIHPPDAVKVAIEKLPEVTYDKIQLGQVIQNLIENAIKYNDKENPVIEIGYIDKPIFHEIFIRDNGPGIDPRFHHKIFKIFQTLTPRDVKESTGIGLAIVEKIVRMNGGKVWLEAAKNEGAEFHFTIPKEPIKRNGNGERLDRITQVKSSESEKSR